MPHGSISESFDGNNDNTEDFNYNLRGSPNVNDFNTFMSVSSADSLRRIERNRNAAGREFEAPFKLKLALVRDLVGNEITSRYLNLDQKNSSSSK